MNKLSYDVYRMSERTDQSNVAMAELIKTTKTENNKKRPFQTYFKML